MADVLSWLYNDPKASEKLAELLDPRAMAAGMGTAPSEGAAQFGSNFIPIAGDALGVAQDLGMYATDPSSRSFLNYMLTLASLVPAIPAASAFRKAANGLDALLDSRGFKRVKSTGRFVGAPEWVKSSDDVVLAAEEYAQRIERALDAGVDPDYFYRKGEEAIRGITDSPQAARDFAETVAITSSEAPVRANVGWSVKAFDQRAAGVPINTGKYPTETSKTISEMFTGSEPHLGIKRHRYGQGLSGIGRQMPDEVRRAPNDRFEIRSLRYGKDSASEQQHYFIDKVRQMAREIVNERRGLDLDVYNAQELNWATQRADDMGIDIGKAAGDNVQDSLDYYTFQHSWETMPGKTAGYSANLDMPAHHAAVKDVLIDEAGKDRLVRAMGGSLQRPALQDTPGVFKADVHPYGMQSRSLAFHADGTLDPVAQARIRDTELIRSYFVGLQDVGAGHAMRPSALKSTPPYRGGLAFNLGRPVSLDEADAMELALRQHTVAPNFVGPVDPGSYGIVPTPYGVNVLSTPAPVHKAGSSLSEVLGTEGRVGEFGGTSLYDPYPETGKTKFVLENLSPAGARRADSDEVRLLAGQFAQLWSDAEKSGKALPGSYTEVLKVWSKSGLAGVQEMVKRGLAPAVALSVLAAYERQQRPEA